ncbi:HWE histidine kinase domain-containing protein [Rhizobium sp. S152]|uniref:sensor histidine kinase n=1 Tax=Rhizobium sp. S152 TaxID=3055038 RepID=UPI0025A9C3B6|nr:GAF domain-containing protein [Rhizobium sp. S152]MDM9628450.1 HWE histidine kinase domain-containing protein [Rhizobium sp. S152]
MEFVNLMSGFSDLVIAEREILTRVAIGGPLQDVLRDIILTVEKPTNGEMLASVLLVSDDGQRLIEGAAPSLPPEYNAAVNGIPVAIGVGSCGTAAFKAQPVIVTDIETDPLWADYRDVAIRHGLRACWSMPILASDGKVLGTFANYYHEAKEPNARDLEIISMVTRTTAIAIERHRNEQAKAKAEEVRLLLLRELNHRVKNIFALMDSLLHMSAKQATNVDDYARAVRGRLSALGRAHELVQPGVMENPEAAEGVDIPLSHVIEEILSPYARDGSATIRVTGPADTKVSARSITSMALILHELATNAAKYGALASSEGVLTVEWTEDTALHLNWSERGSASVPLPERTGFGSRLISTSVKGHFGGSIDYEWQENGVDVRLSIPSGAL